MKAQTVHTPLGDIAMYESADIPPEQVVVINADEARKLWLGDPDELAEIDAYWVVNNIAMILARFGIDDE